MNAKSRERSNGGSTKLTETFIPEETPMAAPDYAGYAKSLEAIRDGAIKDYWVTLVDINRHQVSVAKTYLWVAAALLGGYVAILDRLKTLVFAHSYLFVPCALSLLLAAVAFGVCLYAIPARKGYQAIPSEGWGAFSSEAHQMLASGSENVQVEFLQSHIARIDHAWAFNFKSNQARAKLLRTTSWLLIGSFLVAVVVGVVIAAISAPFQEQENTVSTSEESAPAPAPVTTPAPAPAPSPPVLNISPPPPSANIGGPHYSTHSEKPTGGRVFTTDSTKGK